MRTLFQLLAFVLIGLGLPAAALGLFVLGWSLFAPVQPPPSLNEGPGLGRLIGSLFLGAGSLSAFIGLITVLVLRATRPSDGHGSDRWLREHKRLW